jgi:hypothetical protein
MMNCLEVYGNTAAKGENIVMDNYWYTTTTAGNLVINYIIV